MTIAGITRLDTIQRVMDALNLHLATGGTFESFKDAVRSEVVGLALPDHRLDTIFRNNMQGAYMQGHVRRQEEPRNLSRRPFFMYDAINHSRTRPAHMAMDGHIARHDDPVWKRWTPPCGHRCRCSRIALTEAQALQRGYKAGTQAPAVNPDPGWDYDRTTQGGDPIGQGVAKSEERATQKAKPAFVQAYRADMESRERERRLWDEVGGLDDCGTGYQFAVGDGCIKHLANQPTWKSLELPDLRELKPQYAKPLPELLQEAATAEAAQDILRSVFGIAPGSYRVVTSPVSQIIIDDLFLYHIVEKRADRRERYASLVLPTLTQPLEIWRTQYEDGPRDRYISLFEGRTDLMAIIRVNQDGSLLWNLMQGSLADMNRRRTGDVVWRGY